MGVEIERKFLVTSEAWRASATAYRCRQAYLVLGERQVVRVRRLGEQGFLTIKGNRRGLTREEYEYEIPAADVAPLIALFSPCPQIDKTRHLVPFGGFEWEVDEFHGDNAGLVVAEIELDSEEQAFPLPPWAGADVSHIPRYLSFNLARRPWSQWTPQERAATAS